MYPSRTSKRAPPSSTKEPAPKRSRRIEPEPRSDDIIIIDSSEDEDDPQIDGDMKDILAQIAAQEESEKLARKLQDEYDNISSSAFGSRDLPIDLENDLAMARLLSDKWAQEDNIVSDPSEMTGVSFSKTDDQSAQHRSTSFAGYKASYIRSDEALQPFKDVFIKTRSCSKCRMQVKSPRGYVSFLESGVPSSLTQLLHASCSSCRTNHCRGCFATLTCAINCKGPVQNPKCVIIDCCAEIRAIAIFETLGGFDRECMTERAAADSRALVMEKEAKGNVNTVGPGGTGYSRDYYSGSYHHLSKGSATSSQLKKTNKAHDHWEEIVVRVLSILSGLLPKPYREEPQLYDLLPHPSIGHLISLSQLPSILATLLRNDSVDDWISRKETYNAMLELMRRLADSELTIPCLIGSHWEIATSCGLENWMWGDGMVSWATNSGGKVEAAAPLYTYFKKLTKQSEAFLAGALHMLSGDNSDAEVDEVMVNGTSLCGDIMAVRDELERAISIIGQPTPDRGNREEDDNAVNGTRREKKDKGKSKGRETSVNFDKIYAEACEKLAFKHVCLGRESPQGGFIYPTYNYAQQLVGSQDSTRLPKSRLHLLKELVVTATSLPPGIWVRVDEIRNDAIKIMIAGPDGTPYSGGLFEFDCFIPLDYPVHPPLMHLQTTGGGTVRFNPNLYNNGKVCLSLLGTWQSRPEEQWSPQSTLLQVLVSIQSMILIDAPYYNEPGHGPANLKAPVSITYNRNISLQTVRWAIVDWLDNRHHDGIWADVIASHFSLRKDKIREQIVQWSIDNASIRSYTSKSHSYIYDYEPYQPPNSTKGKGKEKGTAQGMDLLEMFDNGVKIVESWTTE